MLLSSMVGNMDSTGKEASFGDKRGRNGSCGTPIPLGLSSLPIPVLSRLEEAALALRQRGWIPVFQPAFDRGSVVPAHPQPCVSLLAAPSITQPMAPPQRPGVLPIPPIPLSQLLFLNPLVKMELNVANSGRKPLNYPE